LQGGAFLECTYTRVRINLSNYSSIHPCTHLLARSNRSSGTDDRAHLALRGSGGGCGGCVGLGAVLGVRLERGAGLELVANRAAVAAVWVWSVVLCVWNGVVEGFRERTGFSCGSALLASGHDTGVGTRKDQGG